MYVRWLPQDRALRLQKKQLVEPNRSSQNGSSVRGKALFVSQVEEGLGTDKSQHEDSEEEIPWTPSPIQHKLTPARAGNPSPIPSPTQARMRNVPSPRLAPKVPQKGPEKAIRPAPTPKPSAWVPPDPSSNLSAEPDIEYRPPRAITDVVVNPVNRALQATRPAPTPPSAQQMIIPSTWKDQSTRKEAFTDIEPKSEIKRTRLMKVPKFDNSQMVEPNSTMVPATSGAPPVEVVIDTQISNTTSASSNQATGSFGGYPSARTVFKVKRKHSPGLPSSPKASVTHKVVTEEQSSNSVHLPPNGPPSQAPYIAFTVAYPDYQGSLGDFIRGVQYVIDLQQRRQLVECLYDDVIRAFAHEYLKYIDNFDKQPHQLEDSSQPLSMIHWYNENLSKPIYTNGIITRSNVMDVLKYYPEEVRSVHRSLENALNTSSQATSATGEEYDTPPSGREGLSLRSSPPIPQSHASMASSPIIARVEPLRSVDASVMTLTHAGSSPTEKDNGKQAARLSVELEEESPAPQRPFARRSSPPAAPFEDAYKAPLERPRSPSVKSTDRLTQPPPTATMRFLTQPPATAASYLSDFTRSVESIPETAIKPKHVPRHNLGSTHQDTSGIPDSSRNPQIPPSSAMSVTSARARKPKPPKEERFRRFMLRKSLERSSAPRSTIED